MSDVEPDTAAGEESPLAEQPVDPNAPAAEAPVEAPVEQPAEQPAAPAPTGDETLRGLVQELDDLRARITSALAGL